MSIATNCLRFSALALLACSGCDKPGDGDAANTILRAAYVADDGLGIAAHSGREAATIAATQIGLTARERTGRIVPSLASSWRVSDDGLSYVFKLREAYWTDGRRMTAGDVVAVLRRIVSPGSVNPLKHQFMMIENAAAVASNRKPARMLGVDDPRPDTVVITLDQAEPELLLLLADPAAAILRLGDKPPASGPFAVAGSKNGVVSLARNTTYFAADIVMLDGAALSELDAETAIRRFSAGEFDVIYGGRIGGIRTARTAIDAKALRLEPTWGLYFYLARSSGGPLSDIGVRRALAMSIDRTGIVSRIFGIGGLQPAFGALPPTLPDAYAGSAADWAQWTPEARKTEAIRLLAEAGYSIKQPLELAVAIPGGREHADLLAEIAAYWGELGVRVKAYARGPLPHRQAIANGNYDLALVEHIATAPIAGVFLSPFTCARRLGGYCNPAVDKLIADAAQTDDSGTRIQLQRRANRLISEDAPLIAVLSPVRWSLVSPRVHGWEDNVAGAHPLSALSIGDKPPKEK